MTATYLDRILVAHRAAAAADLRALRAERGVGERLERLVEAGELVRDALELVARVQSPVERVNLVAEAVEAREDRVELAVVEAAAIRLHCR